MSAVRVLIVGLEPSLIDFASPAYAAFPGMTAEKVMAGLRADEERLKALGYDASLCLVDLGETAEAVLRRRLREGAPFDGVLIGAGVRLIAPHTPLFEALVNAAHEAAPRAKFCFNTSPGDTAEAVRRCFPAPTRADDAR